jgi:hypothetical protein
MTYKKIKLGEISKVSSSKRIFAKQYVKSGVPFYRQKEIINKKNKEELKDRLYINEELYTDIKKKYGVPKKGDILITAVGATLGIPYVVEDEVFYFKDGNLIWLSNFSEIVDSKYLYYWITSDIGQKSMWARVIGSAQPALTIDTIKQFEISIPSYETQCKVSSILSTYDDLIENNQKQIKLLEEAAQRIYKEWFVEFRFPGSENIKFIDGIPEDWVNDRADSFFKVTIGKTPPRVEKQWFTKGMNGIPWISISDMGNEGVFVLNTSEKLTSEAVIKHNVKVVPGGTILVSFKLTVGRVAIATTDMCTNEAIAHFYINNPILREYSYFYLKNFEYDTLGNTSSISKAVNSKIIKAMSFIMPSEEVLKAFSLRVNPILREIKIKQNQCSMLIEARDRLLPKLMNGEIEV